MVAPDCAPVMTVSAGGKPITLRPSGGPGGLARFQAELLAALGLQQGTEIQLVFECIEPFTGELAVTSTTLCGHMVPFVASLSNLDHTA